MPELVGYFGRGWRGTPINYPSESPAAKRRRLNALEDTATALGFPEVAGVLNSVADATSGDQLVPPSFAGPPSSGRRLTDSLRRPNQSRSRKMPRWRSRFRRRRAKPSRTFKRKVGSALLSFAETRRQVDSVAQATFSAGDGTTRVLYIASPISNISQDVTGDDFTGDSFWIKSCWCRGRIAIDQTTNSLRVRILLIATHQFADLPLGWTTYGNTTTATTNPAQDSTVGETNIRIFETTAAEVAAQPSAPFVGNATGIDIIESDFIQVLGGREYFLGTENANYFQNVDIHIPVNRKYQIQSDIGEAPVDQLRSFRHRNYYWIMQVFSNSNANNILAAQDILGTFDLITYIKDV